MDNPFINIKGIPASEATDAQNAAVDQGLEKAFEMFEAEGAGNVRTLARLQANQRITGHDYRRLTLAMVIALQMVCKREEEIATMDSELKD